MADQDTTSTSSTSSTHPGYADLHEHIARLEAAGQFPKRIRLGQNRVAWLLSEVEEWLDVRIAKREASVNH